MELERDLPRPAGDLADDGVPATEEVRDEVLRTGEPGVADMPMPDAPKGARRWGTTDFEQQAGEPLDVRLAQEVPDGPTPPPAESQRLMEPGAETGAEDVEADAVGEEDPSRDDSLAPEEAAMTVRSDSEGLGLTDDEEPGYLGENG